MFALNLCTEITSVGIINYFLFSFTKYNIKLVFLKFLQNWVLLWLLVFTKALNITVRFGEKIEFSLFHKSCWNTFFKTATQRFSSKYLQDLSITCEHITHVNYEFYWHWSSSAHSAVVSFARVHAPQKLSGERRETRLGCIGEAHG